VKIVADVPFLKSIIGIYIFYLSLTRDCIYSDMEGINEKILLALFNSLESKEVFTVSEVFRYINISI